MKVTAVDHIGIAVEDMEEALRFYRDQLGLEPGPIQDSPEYGLRICRVYIGPLYLELLEARDWNRTMQRALPHQGPGVYHVGLRVDDVDASIADLSRQGVALLDNVPREGEDMRIAYVSPASTNGALLELVTRTKQGPRRVAGG